MCHADFAFVRLSDEIESFIRLAVQGITIHQRLQAGDRSSIAVSQVVEAPDPEFAISDHFLNLHQLLLCLGNDLLILRILQNDGAVFLLGANGVGKVAVGFFHLRKMDVGNL